MEHSIIQKKAKRIRDVIKYIKRFKNATIIIHMDDSIIDSPLFKDHIQDICLIHEAGLRVIIIPGAKKRIDEILTNANIKWSYQDGIRITSNEAIPLVKMAAFDVSNKVMTALAGEGKTAVIGNWVRARSKGVINGIDYQSSGEIDKLQDESIKTVLDNGFIPIFPCIGWSITGKPYNISSVFLAEQIAIHLQADKLFFLLPNAEITNANFIIPESIGTSTEGNIPALNLEELGLFVSANKRLLADDLTNNHSFVLNNKDNLANEPSVILKSVFNSTNEPSVAFENNRVVYSNFQEQNTSLANEHSIVYSDVSRETILSLLKIAKNACSAGVSRVHIIDSSYEGSLPCEIFSDLGSGTMIYSNGYGKIREMTHQDITTVLSLMQPFVDKGILLPRTEELLSSTYSDYIVYEIDDSIRACAALHSYNDGQMEIAAVAVDETCAHIGIGPKMISYLIDKAKKLNATSVFILTTQTVDWFEKLGFTASEIFTLPEKRKELWSPKRGSKLMRLQLK